MTGEIGFRKIISMIIGFIYHIQMDTLSILMSVMIFKITPERST